MKTQLFHKITACVFVLYSSIILAKPIIVKDLSKVVVITKANPEFTVQIAANPTTGYTWVLDGKYPSNLIKPLKHQFTAPSSKLIGAGGIDEWTFKVQSLALVVPTTFEFKLIYGRPWERKSASVQTVTVKTTN